MLIFAVAVLPSLVTPVTSPALVPRIAGMPANLCGGCQLARAADASSRRLSVSGLVEYIAQVLVTALRSGVKASVVAAGALLLQVRSMGGLSQLDRPRTAAHARLRSQVCSGRGAGFARVLQVHEEPRQ